MAGTLATIKGREAHVDKPMEPDDEDLYASTPPAGPSPREVRKRWADEGNIEGFLYLIRTKCWSGFSIGEQLQNLLEACRVGAKRDPEMFYRKFYSEMAAFDAFLMLRTQIYLAERVVGRGPMPSTGSLTDLSPDVVERIMPRLLEMQRAMAEILNAQANTNWLWTLARARDSRDEKAIQAGRKAPRRARPSSSKPARSGPSKANAKAEVPCDGVLPLPARGRRRG